MITYQLRPDGSRVYPDKLTVEQARVEPYTCPLGHTTLPYVSTHRTRNGTVCVIRTCRVCQRDRARAHKLGLSTAAYRARIASGRIQLGQAFCLYCDDTGLAYGRVCPHCKGAPVRPRSPHRAPGGGRPKNSRNRA